MNPIDAHALDQLIAYHRREMRFHFTQYKALVRRKRNGPDLRPPDDQRRTVGTDPLEVPQPTDLPLHPGGDPEPPTQRSPKIP